MLLAEGTLEPKPVEATVNIYMYRALCVWPVQYRGADKSLARPTSRNTLFDGKNISFDASLVIYIYIHSINIPPIIIINRIYENKNLLSL